MTDLLCFGPETAKAVARGRALVALETAVLTHGLPGNVALDAYLEMMEAVRLGGGEPAPVGMVGGRLVVGLDEGELYDLTKAPDCRKAAIPDLPVLAAMKANAGTTAGATLWAARSLGLRIVATGGIGGVHRGAAETFDVSGDLTALSRLGGLLVSSGAKSLCDLPKTFELLETLGVPVVGYGTRELPAFTSRTSGVALTHCVNTPEEAAAVYAAAQGMGFGPTILLANPPPEGELFEGEEADLMLSQALAETRKLRLLGPKVTPKVLTLLNEMSRGLFLRANRALLNSNATLAARIATLTA